MAVFHCSALLSQPERASRSPSSDLIALPPRLAWRLENHGRIKDMHGWDVSTVTVRRACAGTRRGNQLVLFIVFYKDGRGGLQPCGEARKEGGAEYLRFGRTNSKFTNENKGRDQPARPSGMMRSILRRDWIPACAGINGC
jgi:hypothetical protein